MHETSSRLDAEDLDNLQHMLGVNQAYKKRDWGNRNSFCCEIGSPTEQRMVSLVYQGLVSRGAEINDGRDVYFYATEAGCRAAGLKGKQIARAMGNG